MVDIGAWFRRMFARTKEAVTHEEVIRRLAEAERALKMVALENPQAQADHGRLTGAAALLEAIGENNAVVIMGSVLLIRRANVAGPGAVYIRNLVQSELIELEKNPALLQDPEALYVRLSGFSAAAEQNRVPTLEGMVVPTSLPEKC